MCVDQEVAEKGYGEVFGKSLMIYTKVSFNAN